MSKSITHMKGPVKTEIFSSFTKEEIILFVNFDEFWDQVDAQNAYEEEWQDWKNKGIKNIYLEIYQEIISGEKS